MTPAQATEAATEAKAFDWHGCGCDGHRAYVRAYVRAYRTLDGTGSWKPCAYLPLGVEVSDLRHWEIRGGKVVTITG